MKKIIFFSSSLILSLLMVIAEINRPAVAELKDANGETPKSLTVLTESNKGDLIGGQEPIIMFFCASWVGPCKFSLNEFGKFASASEGHSSKYRIFTVDIDENEALANEYGIDAMPTYVVIVDGKQTARFTKTMSSFELEE